MGQPQSASVRSASCLAFGLRFFFRARTQGCPTSIPFLFVVSYLFAQLRQPPPESWAQAKGMILTFGICNSRTGSFIASR